MSETPFWKDRPTLVTGCSGYLARALTAELASRGARVLGLDRHPPAGTFPSETAVLDLRDTRALSQLLDARGIRTIFHLAGQSGVHASAVDPAAAFEANALVTWSLLDAVRRSAAPAETVAVSSNHVYGSHPTRPTPEDAALLATAPYAASKACGDIAARCFAQSYGLAVGVARITNTFGGADPHSKHLITSTISAALRGEPPVVTGNPASRKGYLYISDTIEALVLLAERLGPLGLRGEAFNFCPDESWTVLEVVAAALKASGRGDLVATLPAVPPHEPETEHLSNAKAAKVLGWRPRLSFADGLAHAVRDVAASMAGAR